MDGLRLYKFIPKEYALDFLIQGIVKIGTLLGYRDVELGEGRYDPLEGIKKETGTLSGRAAKGTELASVIDQKGLLQVDWDTLALEMNETTFNTTVESPDLYVYCLSRSSRKEVMRGFEGEHVCFEIIDLQNFFSRINIEMIKYSSPTGIHQVKYSDDPEQWSFEQLETMHPAVVKSEKFSHQDESRAIWLPSHSSKIEAKTLKLGRLTNCCAATQIM